MKPSPRQEVVPPQQRVVSPRQDFTLPYAHSSRTSLHGPGEAGSPRGQELALDEEIGTEHNGTPLIVLHMASLSPMDAAWLSPQRDAATTEHPLSRESYLQGTTGVSVYGECTGWVGETGCGRVPANGGGGCGLRRTVRLSLLYIR